MARRVVWTDIALEELREVAEYVAQSDSPEASVIVSSALSEADQRAVFPESGAIVPEVGSEVIREVIIKRAFRLIYEVSDDRITILGFIRARKRLDRKALGWRRSSN
jgi:toxin ParE1/3/4